MSSGASLAAKWIFRVGHVYPVAAITGKVFFDYLFRDTYEPSRAEVSLEIALDVILIISGLVNMIMFKSKENFPSGAKLWRYILIGKFFITIFLLTPFLTSVSSISRKSLNAIQFYVMLIFFIVSAFMRFYRELHTAIRSK